MSSCRFLDDDPFSRTKGWSSRVRLLLSLCCVCGYLQLCTSGSHVIRNTFNEHYVLTPKTRRQNSPSRPRGGYHRCWKWWTRRVEDLHTRYPKAWPDGQWWEIELLEQRGGLGGIWSVQRRNPDLILTGIFYNIGCKMTIQPGIRIFRKYRCTRNCAQTNPPQRVITNLLTDPLTEC